ncbi:MAG: DUF5106 domain-containing protein [Bacteroides sp.]|nr:DUF5106 domain-containing protein [Bacteroides sp.]
MRKSAWITFLFVWVLLPGCQGQPKESKEEIREEAEQEITGFRLPDIPPVYTTPESRREFLIQNYWTHFDFSDTSLVHKPEVTEQAFVDYVVILPGGEPEVIATGIGNLMKSAAAERTLYNYFLELSDKYLYDPNSPMRNEEYYIPVVEYHLGESWLPDTERQKYNYQLKMLYKNRVGEKATDFFITRASGQKIRLYDIDADYIILYFNNPGCHACAETREMLLNSLFIKRLDQDGQLKVVAVYPDEDLEEWKKELPVIPESWINGYDAELAITKKELYDLRAIPSLYLLDREKRVLVKDGYAQDIIKYLSGN